MRMNSSWISLTSSSHVSVTGQCIANWESCLPNGYCKSVKESSFKCHCLENYDMSVHGKCGRFSGSIVFVLLILIDLTLIFVGVMLF